MAVEAVLVILTLYQIKTQEHKTSLERHGEQTKYKLLQNSRYT